MRFGEQAYLPFREQFVALDPERYPPEYIDAQVWAGFWACWGTENAAILAEIKTYPSGLREVHGLAAAGDVQEIVALIPMAEAWGKQQGCRLASIESRPGWAKVLDGYEVDQVRIVKELD
ncbi:hypothetical protein [Pelagerythrobacter marinus]|uniref:hypothetical protein n=1 Tax=Pelagerythrobacter marinus TaxID=538382 RepID=UPI002AC9753F|nr:hypothetical protein [Pelagerythrobacter marinus]WPZ05489.1 hypothetical protein T8T98_08590 [Pelagerythrobacter marinus]